MRFLVVLALVGCSSLPEHAASPSPAEAILEARKLCYLYELNPDLPRDEITSEACAALIGRCEGEP